MEGSGLYVQRKPEMKMKVVDGTSLAVAVNVNSIPKGTTQVLLRGKLTKVAYALAFALCQKGLQVLLLTRKVSYQFAIGHALTRASTLLVAVCPLERYSGRLSVEIRSLSSSIREGIGRFMVCFRGVKDSETV
ncbi:hypothetical protein LWI28_011748 [Acer negundo]|uniref:Very-long-chain aldehyde decarbonylase CER1-like C-terminal domain-containing protein n=1 Tax=Acer negundo TaxID=4023 RepID=A0AAD5IYW9_ACENE|nr:hypothetical protein LWI28_011748 [Acer negundo]